MKKVAENVANDVSHKPTMSGANRTQQVIVRNSSSIELQVSVPGINQDYYGILNLFMSFVRYFRMLFWDDVTVIC